MDSPDIMHLVFQNLVGDYDTLLAVGLTCRSWHSLSLPALLQDVDLSCHNLGDISEDDDSVLAGLTADVHSKFRPNTNLVPRQRAFLRLMMAKPTLSKYMRSFTYTLIWRDFEDEHPTEDDRLTWGVFKLLNNVTRLDLASLHDVCDQADDYIRRNPATLFPAVTDLRLLGWMHRDLIKAILGSVDSRRLETLNLDHLMDEGSLPDGSPLQCGLADEYAQSIRNIPGSMHHSLEHDTSAPLDEDVRHHQETGAACVFPAPMWFAAYFLRSRSLDSLSSLTIRLCLLNVDLDLRSYHTFFEEAAKLLVHARKTLRSVVISFAESRNLYPDTMSHSGCGNHYMAINGITRPWSIKMASIYLNKILKTLDKNEFPRLQSLRCEGFHLLKIAEPRWVQRFDLEKTYKLVRECRVPDASIIDTRNVERSGGPQWCGHEDFNVDDEEKVRLLLEQS